MDGAAGDQSRRPDCRCSKIRLPLPAAPLRSRSLPQPALPARRQRRSLRHLGRVPHRPAAPARPARLRSRNRRTLPSTRWHAARFSRRPASPHPIVAPPRTRRTPPCSRDHGAETKNPNTIFWLQQHRSALLQPRPPQYPQTKSLSLADRRAASTPLPPSTLLAPDHLLGLLLEPL